ncbi:ATP-binding protein [Stygiolobus caldivivus]|uniref:ATPase AAA n=1 Tax=Stygiolobus caldivivus TaxID=2824673 RepID=A0A8D5U7M0_9CREN|nr:ATP-binding protein [Stygiolobus caldivivus]BCU71230.1 ATPase AAA [Stygiolobus caldivivus]
MVNETGQKKTTYYLKLVRKGLISCFRLTPVERFKSVIAEWLTSRLPDLVERDVSLPLDKDYIITVTGGRRSGKTFLLYQAIREIIKRGMASQDEILYVDFEDYRVKGISVDDLDKLLTSFIELTGKQPKYLFFDEIQNVRGYGSWFRKKINAKIYLSGSSSQLTPINIAEELRGRSINYEVYPLSFREFLRFKGIAYSPLIAYTPQRGILLSLLREYLYYGSYPAVVLEREDKVKLLRSYFDSVIVRDLSNVTPNIAESFATYLVANYSSLITINRVYNYLRGLGIKIGKETVLELFSKAKESYFSYFVEEFDKSESKRKVNPKKLYVVDTGYSTALGYEFSISRAMENAVFIELLRRGYKEVYYWKGKREVDFVVSKNFTPITLIQVTYATDKVEERETEGILEAKSRLKVDSSLIITWDYEGEVKGIKALPLWKWLLSQEE